MLRQIKNADKMSFAMLQMTLQKIKELQCLLNTKA